MPGPARVERIKVQPMSVGGLMNALASIALGPVVPGQESTSESTPEAIRAITTQLSTRIGPDRFAPNEPESPSQREPAQSMNSND